MPGYAELKARLLSGTGENYRALKARLLGTEQPGDTREPIQLRPEIPTEAVPNPALQDQPRSTLAQDVRPVPPPEPPPEPPRFEGPQRGTYAKPEPPAFVKALDPAVAFTGSVVEAFPFGHGGALAEKVNPRFREIQGEYPNLSGLGHLAGSLPAFGASHRLVSAIPGVAKNVPGIVQEALTGAVYGAGATGDPVESAKIAGEFALFGGGVRALPYVERAASRAIESMRGGALRPTEGKLPGIPRPRATEPQPEFLDLPLRRELGKSEARAFPEQPTGEKGRWKWGAEPAAAIPGEPVAYLDRFGDKAKAAIEWVQDEATRTDGYRVWKRDGTTIQVPGERHDVFPTLQEAQQAAEAVFPKRTPPVQQPRTAPVAEQPAAPKQGVQNDKVGKKAGRSGTLGSDAVGVGRVAASDIGLPAAQAEARPLPREVRSDRPGAQKAAWELGRDELAEALRPGDKTSLERARPLLAEVFPEFSDLGKDPWGIARAVQRGDELPRVPFTDFTKRHRSIVARALSEGKPVPPEVLKDYPDLAKPTPAAPKQAWEMTAKEWRDKNVTGHIPSTAYEKYKTSEGLKDFIRRDKYPEKVEDVSVRGSNVEIYRDRRHQKYVKTDAQDEIIRDQSGLATYLSDAEATAKGLPIESADLAAFVGDRPVAFASNEFGTTGIWVVEEFQRGGLGARLLQKFRELNPRLASKPLGQATGAGENLIYAFHRKSVADALKEGKPVPPEVLKDYPDLVKAAAPKPKAIPKSKAAPEIPEAAGEQRPEPTEQELTDGFTEGSGELPPREVTPTESVRRQPKVASKPETPKEAVKEIIEGKRESKIGLPEFKERMIAELDKAIADLPVDASQVSFQEAFQPKKGDVLEVRDTRTGASWVKPIPIVEKNGKFTFTIPKGTFGNETVILKDTSLDGIKRQITDILGKRRDASNTLTIQIPGDGEFQVQDKIEDLLTIRRKVERIGKSEGPQIDETLSPARKRLQPFKPTKAEKRKGVPEYKPTAEVAEVGGVDADKLHKIRDLRKEIETGYNTSGRWDEIAKLEAEVEQSIKARRDALVKQGIPRSQAHKMAKGQAEPAAAEVAGDQVAKTIADNLAEVDAAKPEQLGAGFNPFGRSKVTRGPGALPSPEGKPLLDKYIETERATGRSGLGGRIKEGFKDRFLLFHQLRGEGKEFFADARENLRQLMAVPRVSRRTATDAMRGVVGDLRADEFNAVRKRIIAEDFAEAVERSEALPGGLEPKDVTGRLKELVAEVDGNLRLRGAYDRHRKLMQAVQDDLVARGKLDKENLRKNYFHHEVIAYLDKQGGLGAGRRVKTPQRGYLKTRKGSTLDINTDYLDVTYRHLAKVFADNALDDAIVKLAGRYAERVKAGQWEGPTVDWQPQPGNAVYRAATTTDAKVLAAIQNTLLDVAETLHLDPAIFKEGLVLGAKRKTYNIPAELAYILDNFKADNSFVPDLAAKALGKWKQFVLNKNPVRYNRRNFLGDSERAVNAIPALATKEGVKAFGDAFHDVVAAVRGGKLRRPADYQSALERDVVSGGEIAYEIGQVKDMPEFVQLDPKSKYSHMLKFAGDELRDWTIARENLLRLQVHYFNIDRMRAGKPIKTGISDIKGITEPLDQIGKVSREALGDYGAFTPYENVKLRNRLGPFYSWLKINTTFWPMLVYRQGLKTAAAGRALTLPVRIGRVAGVVGKATALYVAADVWNNTKMQDIEDGLPDYVKDRFHVVLGESEDGNPIVLTDPTAFSDFMETVGAEGLSTSVVELLRGQISAHDFALERLEEAGKAPVRKAVNVLNPAIKAVTEVATGRQLYPDVFKPRYTKGNVLQRTMKSVGAGEFSDKEGFQYYMEAFSKPPYHGITGVREITPYTTGKRPPGAPTPPYAPTPAIPRPSLQP